MSKIYNLKEEIIGVKAALLHGDGPTFKSKLNISPSSFGSEESRDHMRFSLHDFSVDSVKQVVELWHSLKNDEPMRCFIPGYRLEFFSEKGLYLKAAICWECNWIEMRPKSEAKSTWFSFDGSSKQATELLSIIRAACEKSI